jgi:hypothetical protein
VRTSLSTLPPVALSTTVLFVMRSRACALQGHLVTGCVFFKCRGQQDTTPHRRTAGAACCKHRRKSAHSDLLGHDQTQEAGREDAMT